MGWEIRQGHALNLLRKMPDRSVNSACCSPPYWGLRSYKTDPQVWGEVECNHVWEEFTRPSENKRNNGNSLQAGTAYYEDQQQAFCVCRGHQHDWTTVRPPGYRSTNASGAISAGSQGTQHRTDLESEVCGCGAWRGELGLEPTVDMFVGHLVQIFRECRRVLTDDGLLLVNIGDSYFAGGGGADAKDPGRVNQRIHHREADGILKPKDLCLVPQRLALAMQADGWWVRQDIIWAKDRPMPESVDDRCTRAHEYIWVFAKSRDYYWNAEAIAEDSVSDHGSGNGYARPHCLSVGGRGSDTPWQKKKKKNRRDVWNVMPKGSSEAKGHHAVMPFRLAELMVLASCPPVGTVLDMFSGCATTGVAATKHGMDYIGLELNPKHIKTAERRLSRPFLFDDVETIAEPFQTTFSES